VIIISDLEQIKLAAAEKETENEEFRSYLRQQDSAKMDAIVHQLNDTVSSAVDCTKCGNCCKSLMINVTAKEMAGLATYLERSISEVKDEYIEESAQGQLIINSIPCHFLQGTVCSIYEQRFTECREFPHLHKPNFTERLFGTIIMYYAMCPIIFNVVEQLKQELGYNKTLAG